MVPETDGNDEKLCLVMLWWKCEYLPEWSQLGLRRVKKFAKRPEPDQQEVSIDPAEPEAYFHRQKSNEGDTWEDVTWSLNRSGK